MLTQSQIIEALQFNLAFDGTGTTTANPFRITYQYANSQPSDLNTQYSGWESWSSAEKATYRSALDHIETLINVEFVEVTGQSGPTLNVGKVDFQLGLAGLGGLSYSTRNRQLNDIDNFTLFNNTINMANATNLILHELGHALGLDHPFEGAAQLPEDQDNNKYTVMSYDRNPENGQDSDAMMLYDILALQDIWGANTSTSTGNSTYTGSRTSNMDSIWGAAGTDTLDASARSNDVTLNLIEGTFSRFGSYDDVSIAFGVSIENATGGSGDDRLIGNGVNNTLIGGAGDDDLRGNAGKDRLYDKSGADQVFGGSGNDYIRVGRGEDSYDGGSGKDYISYYDSAKGVRLDLEANAASRLWASNDTILNFDSASGSKTGNDTLLGTDGANTFKGYGGREIISGRGGNDKLYGGDDADKIYGGADNDKVYGGDGADRLYGSAGADTLYGEDGNDFLDGGFGGTDLLYGGGGADDFQFDKGEGTDIVKDFQNNIDTIQFDNFDTLTDAASALALATEVGDDVLFTLGGGDSLLVENTSKAELLNDIEIV